MSQNDKNAYTEEEVYYENDGEISFKGIFAFLKKSFVRMCIYLLVTMVIATGVFLGMRAIVRGDYFVSAMIEYTYDGVDEGLNPDGTVFNKENVRAANIISSALGNAGLTQKVVDSDNDIANVRALISIDGVMPDSYIERYNELILSGMTSADAYATLALMTFYPSRFIISFANYEQLGLSRADATKFMDELLMVYSTDFVDRYTNTLVLSDGAFKVEAEVYDYLDYVDIFENEYTLMSSYLTRMSGLSSTIFTSSGKSFAALANDLNFLELQLSSLQLHVTSNMIFNNIESVRMNTMNKIESLQRDKARIETIIKNIQDQLDAWKPNQSTVVPGVGDPIISVTYPQEYNTLQGQLTSYSEQLALVIANIDEQEALYDKISGETPSVAGEEEKKEADERLLNIRERSIELIAAINQSTTEYMSRYVTANNLRTVSPTAYHSETINIPTLLIYLIAAVVGIGAALIVTGVKVSNAKKNSAVKVQVKSEEE